MGTLYKRGRFFWAGFTDVDGERVYRSTGETDERRARRLLAEVEAEIARGTRQALGCPTVSSYAETTFHVERAARGLPGGRRDRQRFRDYVLPFFGSKRLDEVRPKMIREWVLTLRRQGTHAPRSLHDIYGLVHRFFEDAKADEWIDSNPCALKKGDLPKKVDKDLSWRPTAVFSRREVEQLISDERVPLDRRVVYGIVLLGGMRLGEVAALRWADYDTTTEPLGCLHLHSSYSRLNKKVKSTKTGAAREVPVHSVLAALLGEWRLSGWAMRFGRAPSSSDLLVPNRRGGFINDQTTMDGRRRDFAALEMRPRRLHDGRRTFISLAQSDGANREVLETITHRSGGQKDQVAGYTTFPFPVMCAEVSKLRVQLVRPEVRRLLAASGSLQSQLQSDDSEGQTAMKTTTSTSAQGEIRTPSGKRPYAAPRVLSSTFVRGGGHTGPERAKLCSAVVGSAPVAEQLDATLASLRRGDSRDQVALRLEQLISFVKGTPH